MTTEGERMIHVLALWRLEQVERRWRARWEALVVWLYDRWKAAGSAQRGGRQSYRNALNHRTRKRAEATPEAVARDALRSAQVSETSVRERLLRVDEQYRERLWAIGHGRTAGVIIAVGFAVLVGGWASFGFVLAPDGVRGRGVGVGILALAWLMLPPMIALGAMAWGVRTRREDRVGQSRLDVRNSIMKDYDVAWAELAAAEHAAGTRGAAMIVAPRMWVGHDAATWQHYRPSTELLAVPFPWAIDHTAGKLADGDAATVEEFERRAGLRSGPAVTTGATARQAYESAVAQTLTGGSEPYGMWNGGDGADTVYHR